MLIKAWKKKLVLASSILGLFSFSWYNLASDATLVKAPSSSALTPAEVVAACSFEYRDTYNGVVMPQGPTATISTTAGSSTQLQFYNNGTPATTLTVPCTGYYQVFFSIELQANTNVPVVNITGLSLSPLFPPTGGSSNFVIYPQCNNVILSGTTVPASAPQYNIVLYYNTTATPHVMTFAYTDSGNTLHTVTLLNTDLPSTYASTLAVLQAGGTQLTDAELNELYTAVSTKVPSPNTPIVPYCAVQNISGSAQGQLNSGDTITAPSFTTDSSVSVLGGEVWISYIGTSPM